MNSRFDILVPVRRHANIPHPIHSRDVSKHNQQFTPICDRYTIVQQHNTYITGTLYTPFYKIEHNSFLFRIMDTKTTRCTRGDARSFFCTYKTYLYAQNYFRKNKFKYCFKSYIKLHEYANCNSASYDV